MTISVIIPTYNRANSLEQTIQFLLHSEVLPQEIIIVDQTTIPEISNQIKDIASKSPIIRLIHNDVPSLTKARNTGIVATSTDLIIFMDDDVDVRQDTIKTLKSLFESDSKLAMVAGLNEGDHNISKNSLLGMIFGRSSWKRRFKGHVTSAVYGRFPIELKSPVDTEWAMGFFFAVRKSLIDKYNIRFDESLQRYAYAEDLDFTYRFFKLACKEGYQCKIFPEIVVKHNISQEYRIPSRLLVFQIINHRQYLSHKLFRTKKSKLHCWWSNIGSILTAYLHHENWKDYIDAIHHSRKNSADINSGNFEFDS